MAIHVPSIDKAKYKTIGPLYYDVPGAAATMRALLVMKGALKSVLQEVFTSNPSPSDFDEDADDLVFQEIKLEENMPSEGVGRYTFLVGYVPVENVEPSIPSQG